MSGNITEGLFKRPASKAESKADSTNRAAREIISGEAAKREAKTARLREARMALEAAQPAPEEAPKRRRTKAPAAKA